MTTLVEYQKTWGIMKNKPNLFFLKHFYPQREKSASLVLASKGKVDNDIEIWKTTVQVL